MFKNVSFFCLIFIFAISLWSCKKSNSSKTELASLDLSNVNAFLIPTDTATIIKTGSANILYKLNHSAAISAVDYINVDGFSMDGYYAPNYFYQINDLYFLATFSVINSNPTIIDSYIINYSDGKAFKMPQGFYPMKSNGNGWIQETYEKPIKPGPNNSYYFRGENRVFRITVTALDLFTIDVLDISGTSASDFDVDAQGDVMVGNTIYSSPAIYYHSTVFNSANSYISSSFNSGFSLLRLINNNIEAYHLYLKNNKLIEDTISTIYGQGNGWQYIGAYKFSNPGQVIYVFNQGMISINGNSASLITLNSLQLSSIKIADQSINNLYVFATNITNQAGFFQINPAKEPLNYAEIFSPNQYLFTHINILGNDDFSYQAKRLDTNVQVFGFYSATYVNEVINYKNSTASQLITVK